MDGFQEAQEITRKYAKTFYLASRFLDWKKRRAAYAVYAICRISDESVDDNDPAPRQQRLRQIQADIADAYGKGQLKNGLLAAFRQTVTEYAIPKQYFDTLLEGMRWDLQKTRYANFSELYDYCYMAAGVVGLIMLCIFGYKDKRAQEYAVDLGVAMQLTNILRDIREDYLGGRIYLPQDELKGYGIGENDIAQEKTDEHWQKFLSFQISRARDYYHKSRVGIKLLSGRTSRLVALLMSRMYAGILEEIEKNRYNVFSQRARVSSGGKCAIVFKALIGGEYL